MVNLTPILEAAAIIAMTGALLWTGFRKPTPVRVRRKDRDRR